MARIWSGVNLAGCAITIVFKESVEPRRAAMAPPKQYLSKGTSADARESCIPQHLPNGANPFITLLGFDLLNEL